MLEQFGVEASIGAGDVCPIRSRPTKRSIPSKCTAEMNTVREKNNGRN